MTNILAISGSLRRESTNRAVLAAAAQLAPPGMHIEIYPGLGDLPLFTPDLDGDGLPPAVAVLRSRIDRCDGLLICSPEYARGIAGAMKNLLDWLVSSNEFPGKAVAVINASQRAVHADAHLKLTLGTMSARVVEDASIVLPLLGTGYNVDQIVGDKRISTPLANALIALDAAVRRED